MTTTRLPAAERNGYRGMTGRAAEPALGTVTERLNNIIRRQGGRPNGLPRLSPAARAAELAQWEQMSAQAWARQAAAA